MADKTPVKATYSGSNVVGLAEYLTGDTVPVANGGTGTTTSTGSGSVVLNSSPSLTSPSISDPALSGVPTAPTAALSTSTTQIATTEFAVREALTKAVAMSIALG